jgi:drug/metabolite transporter (DMT)-like permease
MNINPPHSLIPPKLVLLFGILAVSTAAIFIRYAQAYAPSLVIAAYRLSLATLVLAPVALTRHRTELRALQGKALLLALFSGFFLALHFATWISSLEYTSVASSVVLVTTTPLWVALLAPFAVKEPLTRLVIIGMVLALAGGITVGLSDACAVSRAGLTCASMAEVVQGKAFLGNLLALTGAIMAAAYILIGRKLRGGMSLVSYIFVVYGMAAIVLLALVLLARHPLFGYPPQAYLWFILLALVPQLLGHSTFNWALRYLSAAYVSITLLGEPIGSTILAYFLLHEAPGALEVFGAILILAGIYIASQGEGQSTKEVQEELQSA